MRVSRSPAILRFRWLPQPARAGSGAASGAGACAPS